MSDHEDQEDVEDVPATGPTKKAKGKRGGKANQEDKAFSARQSQMAMLMSQMAAGDEEDTHAHKSKHNKNKGKKNKGKDGKDEDHESSFQQIEYCPICGFPPELCEYGGNYKQCIVWLKENHPELVPEFEPVDDPMDQPAEEEAKEGEEKGEEKDEDPQPAPSDAQPAEEEKEKPKKVKKEKAPPKVKISVNKRTKRKNLTVLTGLDHFGVKMSDLSKQLAVRYSCSTAVKPLPGGGESIEMQGDYSMDMQEFLMEKLKLKEDDFEQ
ncbi:putative Translation machinery-associated protein 22 [Blattamonas nauphoetae]|uniref:Translation machinery-associated protein 22 n=1 Tax=Blattamonas nauphoetae TaxID=2049346 RepID=A0ABQ9YJV4_9EUKA|nr:putative Translation machinery-associated protein 22 [Blattamonas nauphoetae]